MPNVLRQRRPGVVGRLNHDDGPLGASVFLRLDGAMIDEADLMLEAQRRLRLNTALVLAVDQRAVELRRADRRPLDLTNSLPTQIDRLGGTDRLEL